MAKPDLIKTAEYRRYPEVTGSKVWVQIGMCDGRKDAVRHVESLLREAGIEPCLESSIMAMICVLEADVQKAITVLRDYEDASDYRITLYAA